MQRMFQDKSISKTFNDQYRDHCQKRHLNEIGMKKFSSSQSIEIDFVVDFSIMILTYNVWPFSAPPTLVLPKQVKIENILV